MKLIKAIGTFLVIAAVAVIAWYWFHGDGPRGATRLDDKTMRGGSPVSYELPAKEVGIRSAEVIVLSPWERRMREAIEKAPLIVGGATRRMASPDLVAKCQELVRKREWNAALQCLASMVDDFDPSANTWSEVALVAPYANVGLGWEYSERAAAVAVLIDPKLGEAHYNLACARAMLGKTDSAIDALRDAFRFSPSLRENARTDSDLESIRHNARFAELLK